MDKLKTRMQFLTDDAQFAGPDFDEMVTVVREAMKQDNAGGNDRVKVQMCIDMLVGSARFYDQPGEQTKRFCQWATDMIEMGNHGWPKLPRKRAA